MTDSFHNCLKNLMPEINKPKTWSFITSRHKPVETLKKDQKSRIKTGEFSTPEESDLIKFSTGFFCLKRFWYIVSSS